MVRRDERFYFTHRATIEELSSPFFCSYLPGIDRRVAGFPAGNPAFNCGRSCDDASGTQSSPTLIVPWDRGTRGRVITLVEAAPRGRGCRVEPEKCPKDRLRVDRLFAATERRIERALYGDTSEPTASMLRLASHGVSAVEWRADSRTTSWGVWCKMCSVEQSRSKGTPDPSPATTPQSRRKWETNSEISTLLGAKHTTVDCERPLSSTVVAQPGAALPLAL